MYYTKHIIQKFVLSILVCSLIIINNPLTAQEVVGLSFGYEHFPYIKLADPSTQTQDLEIQTNTWNTGLSFPLVFSKGKILILNNINYRRVNFSYRNFPAGGTEIDQAQSIEYTAFMIDSLSDKWKMVAVLVPGIASDFESSLSSDDFTLQAIFGFIRTYSKNFDLGFGLAYIRDFGPPLPLPFIYIDWKINENLNAKGIVPTDMALTYKLNPRIDLGISLKIIGNRYHGNPNKFTNVSNPQMEYSEGTLSPFTQIHLTKWLHLSIEGGYAVYRNFEFLDGDDSVQSLDLEPAGYIRTRIVLGI